jgi:hypothetical protein
MFAANRISGFAMYLDFFEDGRGGTVCCWKDERTGDASQVFESKQEALGLKRAAARDLPKNFSDRRA